MSGRRAPLADVPNAANSPYRGVATAGKRARSQAPDHRDGPTKRQQVDTDDAQVRRAALAKRSASIQQPTALQRKLEAARNPQSRPALKSREGSRAPEHGQQNLDSIRQWQQHYRRIFPSFVFFLDNIPDDAKAEVLKDIHALGARDEQFFSKAVTHVVTARPVPPASSSSETRSPQPASGQHATVNPSMLERLQEAQTQAKATDVPRRQTADVLTRARDMGMKIWALEKLQRMMNTMFAHGSEPVEHGRTVRSHAGLPAQPDLSALLKQEKLHGPADRDLTVAPQDVAFFRGYYIYVHDMNEQTKPVMIRDYEKPARKEEGKWPQLRATSAGRCPFIDDQSAGRRQRAQKEKMDMRRAVAPRTRAAAAQQLGESSRAPPERIERRALVENNNLATRAESAITRRASVQLAKPLDPPKIIPAKRPNPDRTESIPLPPLYGSAQASVRQQPRFVGGEPVASGMQPSNATSAIKSQMISSTAAAPGARVGTSKEVHQLKRKVFEKNSAASASANSIPSSYMNDVRAAINNPPPQRTSKRLAQIEEDDDEEENNRPRAEGMRKKPAERDLKPGYCENCQEKFNDFEEHVVSKKHRKFALSADNWRELDALLEQLIRV